MVVKCTFEDCDKTFSCKSELNDHINTHLGLKPYKCDICGKSYAFKRYLKAHSESHKVLLECENCKKKFTRKHKYNVHLRKHCSKNYECKFCKKTYVKKGYYENHIENCPKKIKREKKPKTNKIVKCDICKAEYSAKRNLDAHMKSKHENIRFKCDECDKIFVFNNSLVRHKKKIHNKNKSKDEITS